MLKNQWGRYLQHHELYPKLGIEGTILPKEGFTKEIEGVLFRCTPANGGKHRIQFECKCGKWIPFGRAGQHLKACRGVS
jgi:hypothetical protein